MPSRSSSTDTSDAGSAGRLYMCGSSLATSILAFFLPVFWSVSYHVPVGMRQKADLRSSFPLDEPTSLLYNVAARVASLSWVVSSPCGRIVMADRVGEQLGDYRLIRLLGKGSFGEVYLGEHVYLQTQAAIKVLHTQMDPGELQNFLNEARRVATLNHPHIVRLLTFSVEKGMPFMVMQL